VLVLRDTRAALVVAAALLCALAAGALLAESNARAVLLVGALAFVAMTLITFEAPIVVFASLALILALASETDRDDRVLGISSAVFGSIRSFVSLPVLLLALVATVLALTLRPDDRAWPGVPATIATGFLAIGLVYVGWFGPLDAGLYVFRPILVLVLAILVGYWTALRYGIDLPTRALVGAALLAVPLGLYNVASGDIAYYDASFIYLIGVAAILVLFRAVEIGYLREPFLVLSLLVIVLSLRRGAMLGVAITLLVTGIVAGRGTFRTVAAIGAGVVVFAELVHPGLVVSPIEGVVNYFTGASGQDFSVNYRRYEQANALLNVQAHWLWGIGPTKDWTLYRTFDGQFERINGQYLHDSYLWVWLRFGLVGLVTYVAFLLVSAFALIRRSAPVIAVTVGASLLGLTVTLTTASYLTTTVRWPLVVGLFLGIALVARRATSPPLAADG
jgi:O-antigen ligase